MDALRMREFFFEPNNELPNSRVSVKDDLFFSIDLQSILLRVHKRVILLLSNKDGGEKSEKLIQYLYHNYRENQCSFENYD